MTCIIACWKCAKIFPTTKEADSHECASKKQSPDSRKETK